MRLFITRHGETVWNLEHRYQGHGDSALTEAGERQARALAARLAGEQLDAVYSSDLGRAQRTAELIVAGRELPVVRDSAWRERAYGAWEGLTRSEIAVRDPERWERREADRAGFAPPGGESLREVQRRVTGALDMLRWRHEGEAVLVVTHGGALWVLACTLAGEDLAASRRPYLANCGLSRVHWDPAGRVIECCWDDTAHLTPHRDLPDDRAIGG